MVRGLVKQEEMSVRPVGRTLEGAPINPGWQWPPR